MLLLFRSYIRKILPEKVKIFLKKIYSIYTHLRYNIIIYFLNTNAVSKFVIQLLTWHTLELRKFISIENVEAKLPEAIRYLYKKHVLLYFSTPAYDFVKLKKNELVEVSSHYNYGAILYHTTVIGGSSMILLDSQNVLYDVKQYDYQKKYNYTDEGIRYYKNDYCLIKKRNSITYFEKAIFLAGNFSNNYYHLFFEILIKFEQIDSRNIDIHIPILVDRISVEVPQYIELFSCFNKRERKIITLNVGERYKVGQLFYFSCPNYIPPNYLNPKDLKAEDLLFDLNSIKFLRIKLLPLKSKTNYPRKIFISRSKASARRLFNEEEIFEVFEKFGFKKVYPENYSVTDQIAMFNSAEFIAGGSGAAFANLVFCSQSCKIIIFSKNEIPFSGFSTIARYLELNLLYFTEDSSCIEEMKTLHDPFHINSNKLNSLLEHWIQVM